VSPKTLNSAELVYGPGGTPAEDDPAELLHEASKLYASTMSRSTRGVRTLTLQELAAILSAAYGVTHELVLDDVAPQRARSVPSGGALYPLEIYVLALAVDGLKPATLHYVPGRHAVEIVGELARDAAVASCSTPELAESAAAIVAITAVFWRTRFKYGLKGYRLALLEAGHVGQNVRLAATALGLAAVPMAGFFDTAVEQLVGADGVDESLVYVLCLGRERCSA
jgi:SagB-type dehydrogenase family enzyme